MTHRTTLLRCCLLALTLVLACGLFTARSYAGSSGDTTPPTTQPFQRLYGTIAAIGGSGLTLRAGSDSRTFPLAQQVNVVLLDGELGTLAQVSVGMKGLVYVRSINGAPPAVATIVILAPAGSTEGPASTSPTPSSNPGSGNGGVSAITGTVTSIDQNGLTIQTDGGPRTCSFAPHVSIMLASGQPGTLGQITIDTPVRIYVRSINGSAPQVVGIMVQKS